MRLLTCKHVIYLFLRKVMATNAHISLWSEHCLKGIHTWVQCKYIYIYMDKGIGYAIYAKLIMFLSRNMYLYRYKTAYSIKMLA